jgi:chromate transporter
MSGVLLILAVIFSQLSVLAVGGGITVLPEMQRQMVDVHHWMTAQEFSATFALAQAAPGPNLMVVTLIGWHVAGWAGALVTTLGMFGPSSILTCLVMQFWERFKDRPWRRFVQISLVPVTAGLFCASAALLTGVVAYSWSLLLIVAITACLMMMTRIPPLLLLAAGALLGATGIGQP